MRFILIVIIASHLFISCSNETPKIGQLKPKIGQLKPKSVYYSNSQLSDFKYKIMHSGDRNAYSHLMDFYFETEYGFQETFYYSLIMANKYNYPHAYYMVFFTLTDNIDLLDKKTAKMAVDYLFMAAQKGHEQATETIKDYSLNRNMDNIIILKKIFPGEFKL